MRPFLMFLASTDNNLLGLLVPAGSLLLFWGLRMPGGDIPSLLAGLSLVILALVFVVIRIILRLIAATRSRERVTHALEGWRTWMLCAGTLLIIALLGVLGVPFRLAFAISRPQLENLVESYGKDRSPNGKIRAGLFPVASIDPIENGIRFTFRKAEFPWGERGIYYSESGERIENSRFYSQKRIGSDWFSWHYGGW